MAKRPSLLGSGRTSLAAATEAEAPAIPIRRTHQSRREQPPAENAPAAVAPVEAASSQVPDFDGRRAVFAELMDFAGERLRRTAALAETLGRCRTPLDAIAAQSAYARETVAQYAAESYKLVRLSGAVWGEYWQYMPLFRYRGTRRQ